MHDINFWDCDVTVLSHLSALVVASIDHGVNYRVCPIMPVVSTFPVKPS